MTTWLMGFAVEIGGVEMMVYHLVGAENLALAESGAMTMGSTWWDDGITVHEGYSWRWPQGDVWFNSIIQLDGVEDHLLRNLKFLDAWKVTGTTDKPVICDEYGNDWRDITR
ncbi:hypothetical protein [Klebsiella oxytoca]|uniref:hypothetical protein n=1 Tax=Klebsiella oxytoca TaxID=571 RepID=UPI0034D24FF3